MYNFYDNAPANYNYCFKSDCATADKCIRALATKNLTQKRISLNIVNPLLVNTEGGSACPHFKKAEKIRIAYGFKEAMSKIAYGRAHKVRSAVCKYVCTRNYYYMLRGEKPISPDMQNIITSILQLNGLTSPIEFDRYEWQYDWS